MIRSEVRKRQSTSPIGGPVVAVYRGPLLPLSEVFIRDQVESYRRWNPVLLGETLLNQCPPLDTLAWQALYRNNVPGRLRRRTDRIREWLAGHSAAKRNLVASVHPDIVHVHFATDATQLWPSIRQLGKPVVVTLHGYDIRTSAQWWRDGHGGRRMRSYPDKLLAMASDPAVQFVAVSKSIRDTAVLYGIPAERISVCYLGIAVQNFPVLTPPPSQRDPLILFVGRLVEKKGATYLLEAAARLKKRVPSVRLRFIGEGALRQSLQERARVLHVDADFLGAQPHTEVRKQLGQARVLCVPSITATNGDAEGLPMALLEAQASGVPVVTSAKGGADEGIVDQKTGFAFEEKNVDQLASLLEVVLLDDARADAMSSQAAAFVRDRFDIQTCTQQLESFYDRVASSHRG